MKYFTVENYTGVFTLDEKGKVGISPFKYTNPHDLRRLLEGIPNIETVVNSTIQRIAYGVTFCHLTGPCIVTVHSQRGSMWECADYSSIWELPNYEEALKLQAQIDLKYDHVSEPPMVVIGFPKKFKDVGTCMTEVSNRF